MSEAAGGQLIISAVRFTKGELLALPANQRSFYLQLSQINNEIFILYGLLLQSMNSVPPQGGAGPLQETAYGTMFYLARLLAGRLYEARADLNAKANRDLLDQLWGELPQGGNGRELADEAREAKARLNRYFGGDAFLGRVRNRFAFHANQAFLGEAFVALSPDVSLIDYHSSSRGTTFLGVADTVTAFAVARLAGKADIMDGANVLMNDVKAAVEDFSSFIHSYVLAFTVRHFGPGRFRDAEQIKLTELPTVDSARLTFFMAGPVKHEDA